MPIKTAAIVTASEATARRAHDVATTRTSRGRASRPSVGRYDGERRIVYGGQEQITRKPATGLAKPVKSPNMRTVVAAVTDPWGDGIDRIQVTVNRRVDVLEQERSHGRLSEGAYATGRQLQAVFERAGRVGSTNWQGGDRRDPQAISNDMAERAVDAAKRIEALMGRIVGRIGMIDARLLKRILGDRASFSECAALQGKAGENGTNYIGRRFRDALEDLTEAWTAKGAGAVTPDDKHTDAAGGAVERQRASMATRTSEARREEERLAEVRQRTASARKASPTRNA